MAVETAVLGGRAAPALMGWPGRLTHLLTSGLAILATCLLISVEMILLGVPARLVNH